MTNFKFVSLFIKISRKREIIVILMRGVTVEILITLSLCGRVITRIDTDTVEMFTVFEYRDCTNLHPPLSQSNKM